MAQVLLDLAHGVGLNLRGEARIAGMWDRLREISVMGTGVHLAPADGPPPHVALVRTLVELGHAARSDGRIVVIHVDEVQNVDDARQRSQLLVALGDALGHEQDLPIAPGGGTVPTGAALAIYLTGLPEFHDLASSGSGATFARRFATTLLAPISDDDLRDALDGFKRDGRAVATDGGLERIVMTTSAVEAIVEACHGDPFLFQLAGQHAWDAGDGRVIEADDVVRGWGRARSEARRHVERQLERLPDLERTFLEAMAGLDEDTRTLTTIARRLGYDQAAQLGPTSQRLDTVRGIIDRGSRYTFRVRTIEAYLNRDWP